MCCCNYLWKLVLMVSSSNFQLLFLFCCASEVAPHLVADNVKGVLLSKYYLFRFTSF